MKERETVIIPKEEEQEKEGEGTSIDSLLKKANGTKIETIIDETETISESDENGNKIMYEEPRENVQTNLKLHSFNSNKRTSINSSRYNYVIDLEKEGIEPQKLHSLSKIIIPIEDNYIFTLPILNLKIKELDMDVCLQQKDIIESEYNTVGVYEPIENIIFNISYPIRRLSIDIRDISNVKYSTNDILKINIMELKKMF